MIKIFISVSLAFLHIGCNTSPVKNALAIMDIDKAELIKTPLEAVKKLPSEGKVESKKTAFKFTKSDKFIQIKSKNAPVKKAELIIDSATKAKYLVFAGEMHNVGMAKSAGVFPEIFIFNSENKLVKTQLAQVGFDDLCGLFTCLKKAYDISALPAGTYNLIMASYVENPGEVIHLFTNQVYTAGAVGAAVGSMIDQKIYADYFGELVVGFSEKLPFSKENKAARTYEN